MSDTFKWRDRPEPQDIFIAETIVVLNFIHTFQIAPELIPELKSLHAAFIPNRDQHQESDLEILDHIRSQIPVTKRWYDVVRQLQESKKLSGTLDYFIYFQTAQLLGMDLPKLAQTALPRKAEAPSATVQAGDTLAIYVDNSRPHQE